MIKYLVYYNILDKIIYLIDIEMFDKIKYLIIDNNSNEKIYMVSNKMLMANII